METAEGVYLLDSNILIQAARSYYAFDICPGYWDFLDETLGAGRIRSIDKVRTEILKGSDQLAVYVKNLSKDFFISSVDYMFADTMADVTAWATSRYDSSACNKFFDTQKADYWLVIVAKKLGYTLVTHERPDHRARKVIPLATACDELGVSYIQSHDLIREMGGMFHRVSG